MPKSIIAEGKTTEQAIENGLRSLKVAKDAVSIKVLDNEDKKSFFSILAPRVVKVELIVKEYVSSSKNYRQYNVNENELNNGVTIIKEFMNQFIKKINSNDIVTEVKKENNSINVIVKGQDCSFLIGYKGEVLNSLQVILTSIVNKNSQDKIRVVLDIGDYREKRKKTLEDLAVKVSKTVMRTEKSITLEPMSSYERKIIHDKLQDSDKVKTYSIGEELHRRVVISIK